ncbi:hypothetical protein MHH96_16775 [Niallia sp. FSL K6-0212]|jgi:hypothetical protein|uniref:hypothetical protein n=1 Tax=Niallia TaxID=2837506 RepID=UPI001642E3FB|nr:hypothetical protein [Niallia circulans]MED5103178.1 hypothetical protein [Niallia circulans]
MELKTTGRNKYDMIMELLALHVKQADFFGDDVRPEEIEELFKKYSEIVNRI